MDWEKSITVEWQTGEAYYPSDALVGDLPDDLRE